MVNNQAAVAPTPAAQLHVLRTAIEVTANMPSQVALHRKARGKYVTCASTAAGIAARCSSSSASLGTPLPMLMPRAAASWSLSAYT